MQGWIEPVQSLQEEPDVQMRLEPAGRHMGIAPGVGIASDGAWKDGAAPLTAQDMADLQATLWLKRGEILGNMADIEESMRCSDLTEAGASPLDVSNVGTADYDTENKAFLRDSELSILKEIDHCLQRLTTGAYGTCSRCGCAIPSSRLKAIPWTRYCIGCAKAAERGETG